MKRIDRTTAKKYIYATNGKEFAAVFTKKNGDLREMNCMLGVTDGVKGVGRKFDPDEKGLVSVFDVDAEKIVDEMRSFGVSNTDLNRNGMHWYSRRVKPIKKYDHSPEPEDPFNHFDWVELSQLIVRNMEENWLDQMVEKKATELISKIDLLG